MHEPLTTAAEPHLAVPKRRTRWIAIVVLAALALAAAYVFPRAGSRLLASIWGTCFTPQCAYLPTTPLIGFAVVAAVYVGLALVAVRQLRFARGERQSAGVAPRPADDFTRRTTARVRRAWWASIGVILALATILRFDRLELGHFKGDQAHAASLGAAILTNGHLTLLGTMASIDAPFLPGYSYLLAPVAVFNNPVWLAWHAAVLGLLTVLLCAFVGARWYGRLVGVVAALLLAVSFWPAECGRTVWNPCVWPTASLLFLDAALLLAVARQPWALVNGAFWAGVMTHFHVLSFAYLGVLVLAGWIGRRSLGLRHWGVALAVYAGLVSPWLIWQLTPNVAFRDVRHVLETASTHAASIDLDAVWHLVTLLSSAGAEDMAHPFESAYFFFGSIWPWLAWIGPLLALLGLAVAVRRSVSRGSPRVPALMLLAILLTPALPLLRHAYPVFAHYLWGALPMLALLGGLGAAFLWSAGGRLARPSLSGARVRAASGALIGTLLLLHAMGSVVALASLNRVAAEQDNAYDAYGVPGGFITQAARAAGHAWVRVGSSNPILVGGHQNDVSPLVYALGGNVPWDKQPTMRNAAWSLAMFNDCMNVPASPGSGPTVIVLWNADSPVAARLLSTSARDVSAERVERPGASAFGVLVVNGSELNGADIPEREAAPFSACRQYHRG